MSGARRVIAGVLAVGGLAASSGCIGVRGNGNIVTQERDLSDFDGVVLRSVFIVEVETDDEYAVSVKGDENLLELITTELEGSDLVLDVTKNIRPTDDVVVTVTLPELHTLGCDGSGKVYASTFNSDSLHVELSGSGLIEVAGEADSLDVEVSGSGKVQADRLVCSAATVNLSGSGRVYVDAEDSLDIAISGSGEVLYSIEPAELNKAVSGSGGVRYIGG